LDLTTGDPVYSTFDGIIRVSGYDSKGYGKYFVIRHYNGIETVYGHLSQKILESGTYVKAGDIIGKGVIREEVLGRIFIMKLAMREKLLTQPMYFHLQEKYQAS
jgi:hypothetical protein